MLENFGLPVRTRMVGLYSGTLARDLEPLAPARLVPVLRTPEGTVVQDTLAIAETLAERHPQAGLWPADPADRALARGIVAEMHAGFAALRGACPMNLEHAWQGFEPDAQVRADLDRIQQLWGMARAGRGDDSPWLFGPYSLADVFYAPVAARIAGYDLPVSAPARAYVDAHLANPAFRRWRAMGLTKSYANPPYAMPLPKADWPGYAPLPARAVETGPSVNDTCPYSGDPVTHFMQLGGKVYGFCNAFCRDKTMNDPEAWPEFMAIYQS